MDYTGRSIDVALSQDGWLAVRAADGSEAYTRNGNMEINANGQLAIQGNLVMGDGGPIDAASDAAYYRSRRYHQRVEP